MKKKLTALILTMIFIINAMPGVFIQGATIPVAPTGGVLNESARTFSFVPTSSFPAATSYEYSEDGGVTWKSVTANPIQLGSFGIAQGDLLVRVKK